MKQSSRQATLVKGCWLIRKLLPAGRVVGVGGALCNLRLASKTQQQPAKASKNQKGLLFKQYIVSIFFPCLLLHLKMH